MTTTAAPEITINGNNYSMREPKARAWRELTKLQEKQEKDSGNIDIYAEIITKAFADRFTPDDVLDNLNISELMPMAFQCIAYINQLVNERLENVINAKKN